MSGRGRVPMILLPPSEGKAVGGRGRPWVPGRSVLPVLDEARSEVVAALDARDAHESRDARDAGEAGSTGWGAGSGDVPEGGVAAAPTRPAIQRYTGVLYQHLDWPTLPAPARRLGARTVLIASGLWGFSAPGDPLPDYRLKMSASLPPLGRLSSWWRPRLTAALADHLAGRLVWDLLPKEHAAGWDPSAALPARRVTVRFVDARGATVSHWNKALKGALVRHLLTERPAGPEDLAGWEHPSGYAVDEAASDLDAEPALVVLREGARARGCGSGRAGS